MTTSEQCQFGKYLSILRRYESLSVAAWQRFKKLSRKWNRCEECGNKAEVIIYCEPCYKEFLVRHKETLRQLLKLSDELDREKQAGSSVTSEAGSNPKPSKGDGDGG